MKTGYGLLYGMIFLLNACSQPEPREEMYDFIITTEYRNSYDAAGKLSSVNISERNEQNVNGKYMLKDSKHTVQKYKYPEGAICQISTTSDYSPDDVHMSVTGEKSDEDYTVRNGSDTLYYDLSVYLDKEKTKLKYRRFIWKSWREISMKQNCSRFAAGIWTSIRCMASLHPVRPDSRKACLSAIAASSILSMYLQRHSRFAQTK